MNIYVFGMLIDFKACQAKTCAFNLSEVQIYISQNTDNASACSVFHKLKTNRKFDMMAVLEKKVRVSPK